jgi:hypothetical protein
MHTHPVDALWSGPFIMRPSKKNNIKLKKFFVVVVVEYEI